MKLTRLRLIYKLATTGIGTNKVRSILTTLGIIIGIASVIAMLGLGEGAQNDILDNLNNLGTADVATIIPGGSGEQRFAGTAQLSTRDFEFLNNQNRFPNIVQVSPQISDTAEVQVNGEDTTISVTGVSAQLPDIQNIELSSGSFLKDRDIDNRRNVAVIGFALARDQFKQTDNLGELLDEEIVIEGFTFRIVGVLAEQEASNFDDPNSNIYIPYTTAGERIFNTTNFSVISFQVSDVDLADIVALQVEEELAEFRNVEDEPDFQVFTSADLISSVTEITNILTWLLAGIAAISLVVGGVGISNIMLVSVTERTKEIGLRKAIGARETDILWQFLLESVILTLIGGVVGIIFGTLLAFGVGALSGINAAITWQTILLATAVSTIIGIVFGFVPAYKAAKLTPIDALRTE